MMSRRIGWKYFSIEPLSLFGETKKKKKKMISFLTQIIPSRLANLYILRRPLFLFPSPAIKNLRPLFNSVNSLSFCLINLFDVFFLFHLSNMIFYFWVGILFNVVIWLWVQASLRLRSNCNSRGCFSSFSGRETGGIMASVQGVQNPESSSYLKQKEAAEIDEILMGSLGFSVDQLMVNVLFMYFNLI